MFRILVCDDDREIVRAIELYLSEEGYEVLCAYDGIEAVEAVRREKVHLLVVDIMMPEMDGIQAITRIRRFSSIPIICLTAKTEDEDKIAGLNAGADDYMEKPFNPLELVARVKSQLRRYTELGNMPKGQGEHIYFSGGLLVNDDTKEVTLDGKGVRFTPIEYNILLFLLRIRAKYFLSSRFTVIYGMRKP